MAAITATSVGEELVKLNEKIVAAWEEWGDDPTDEQRATIKAWEDEIALKEEMLASLKNVERRTASLAEPREQIPTGRVPATARDTERERAYCGYNSFHEFLTEVRDASLTGQVSPRLQLTNAIGSDEQSSASDPYGGFLAPSGFLPRLLQLTPEMDPTASRVTTVPISAASIDIPARVDKDHSSSVSGGFSVSRRAQTGTIASSRAEFEKVTLKPIPIAGLAYVTEEVLLDSAISMTAIIEQGMNQEFVSELLNEKINGTGAGEMEGILNAPAKISVSRSTATTDDIEGIDLIKMKQQAYRKGGQGVIWLANHDTYEWLVKTNVSGLASTTNYLYHPGNGSDVPDSILGIPIFYTEYVPGSATSGDIILCDWSQYLFGVRTGAGASGSAESIHVRFENHERTFKFWQMNDGRCWWRSVLAVKNGANDLSPIVVLTDE